MRLAFASTIHKSQGRTLERVLIDVRNNIFAPGQLYVALSRARKRSAVLLLYNGEKEDPSFHTMKKRISNPVLDEAVKFALED